MTDPLDKIFAELDGKRGRPKPPPAQLERLTVNTDTKALATWWMQATAGVNYWRAQVPARVLPGEAIQLRYNDLQPSGGGVVIPRQRGNTAIWCFPGSATRGIIMRAQQEAGFRVLIEVDDNYLVTTTHQQALIATGNSSWSNKLDTSPNDAHSVEAHKRLVAFADGIIVTTETLADAYRQVHDHVYVCRNSVDPQDWPTPEKPGDGVFRVGYAASASHLYDAADITRALSWAAAQPNVEVVIYGLRHDWPFPHTQVPWTTDLTEYRKSLALLDVGLCPLRSSAWTDCKSDVKAMEYAMAGAASVVSRTPPYDGWVDSPRALTAETPKDFLRAVKWCVQNQDGARELARNAHEYVLGHRTIEHEIPRWREAVQ